PDGQPRNQIEITLKTDTDSEQQLCAYCRYTKFVLIPGEEGSFEWIGNSIGGDKMRYQAALSDAGRTVEIEVHNSLRVADPESSASQEASEARLEVSFRAADGSRRRIPLLLIGPPYRWVDVRFSLDADGKGIFEYAQDIDTTVNPPAIQCPQGCAVYFTLTGAKFDKEPFAFVPPPDSCIVDIGTNGKEAILTNLHKDEAKKQEHCFYIQVIDGNGKVCRSEDPTIVNVSSSTPPTGGSGEA
ncbi:MAG TPA: hypothetical protein VIW92_02850, partial [Thermoanaerobaculia bacterium]